MEMDHISLGQGGLSPDPMWDNRVAEVRALHPKLIRLFVQEYFNLLPAKGQYHFESLDRQVDEIVRAGATPLMVIAIKPRILFPKIDQDIVDPNDYAQWEELIYRMVSHYESRGLRGLYWEVGNEGDIGEAGGAPYRFTPENYVRYYRHTVAAILRTDPTAHVGGPAVSSWKSPILPALIAFSAEQKVPLNFVSWHIYDRNPKDIEATIKGVKALLAQYPSVHPETILDEWNMVTIPPGDPRIQPAFVLETAWRMKEAGLDYSCYYHIRDYHLDRDQFASFLSPGGASVAAIWWNRMPEYLGLFDYQNVVRPAYFSFELLSRVTGERLSAISSDDSVHAFLSYDKTYKLYSLLFWNFSPKPVSLHVLASGLSESLIGNRRMLDAETPSQDENSRLRPLTDIALKDGKSVEVLLPPYGIQFVSLEPLHWQEQLLQTRQKVSGQ